MSALLDTGILYALVDQGDKWHFPATESIATYTGTILVPAPVVGETCYLVARSGGTRAVARFLRFLVQSNWQICDPTETDYVQVVDILEQYADSRIDFVDTIVMAIAERLSIQKVFTVDRRDFRIYRPRHCKFLELLP